MRILKLSLTLGIVIGSVAAARADFDVAPYELSGKIVTGGHDDVLGSDNISQRVFGYDFFEDPLDPYLIGDPGFNNGTFMIGIYPNNGLLPANSTLGFEVLTNLQYWDGLGAVSFSAAPADVDLGIRRGSTTVHISGLGLSGSVPTIGNTGPPGRLHVHVESQLNFTDGTNPNPPNAPDGVYMIGLRMTLAGSGVANSDPIYFVYNANVSAEIHDQAIEWVQTHLVPEPSTWALMTTALGAVVSLRWRRRRRTG